MNTDIISTGPNTTLKVISNEQVVLEHALIPGENLFFKKDKTDFIVVDIHRAYGIEGESSSHTSFDEMFNMINQATRMENAGLYFEADGNNVLLLDLSRETILTYEIDTAASSSGQLLESIRLVQNAPVE